MPKGDPKGGRPRRMERQHEAMLRAGLRQAGVATRYDRVGPFLRMFVAHRDAMLARYPSPPGVDPAVRIHRFERALVNLTLLAMEMGADLERTDPKAAEVFATWLRGGGPFPDAPPPDDIKGG